MTCGNCGAETTRFRVVFSLDGQVRSEACKVCRPELFERQSDPSDKKLWLGWEYDPRYEKSRDPDGQTRMTPSDSVLQDLEDAAVKRPVGEVEAQAKAIERKRANRRTREMTEGELAEALKVGRVVAASLDREYYES